jgi:methylase of polypeptide subunit release factors
VTIYGGDGPTIDDPEGILLLRDAIVAAGYSPTSVGEALQTEVANGRESAELPLYLHLLQGGGALATLIKLFLLDVDVPRAEAEAALQGIPLERLEAMGVISVRNGQVLPLFELIPTEPLLLGCDAFQEELATPDHVLGVSPSARVLSWLTVRREVERALDVGTGNGVQAILATRHTGHVTALDVNERALRFAKFNAILNGAPPIDFRAGDLFEPVAGEKFDLIVCNPPYVISPETGLLYRDGGMRGDSFSERVVREMPAHLEQGGYGHVLVSWLHPEEADWTLPVRRWVEGNGCDCILLRYVASRPTDYAAAWNRPIRNKPERYAAAIERWMTYFDEIGVETISWGCLIMRRRDGDNWFFPYDSHTDSITGSSRQLLRIAAAQDYLATAGDDTLLDDVFVVADEHRIDQRIRLRDGNEIVERNVLSLYKGLHFQVSIDASTERVLALLDGKHRLGDVLEKAAAETQVEGENFVINALPVIRRMIELGFVLHPEDEPAPGESVDGGLAV